jgi:membrane protease YdiL (CAAX protease family)
MTEERSSEDREAPVMDDDVPSPLPTWVAPVAALVVTGATAGVFQYALAPDRQETRALFYGLFAIYAVFGGLAVLRLHREGDISLVKPRSGDLTFGALVAFVLFGMTFAFHSLFTAPGTERHQWIVRIYLLLGNPFSDGRHLVAGAAALIGLLEELSWRGLVTPLLEERFGIVRGNVATTLLYAVAHVPAVFALGGGLAGPNPLLPLAALGCGAAWAYLRWRMERLPPVLLSHAVFTWMVVEYPLWQ